jgi:hypothetical protein
MSTRNHGAQTPFDGFLESRLLAGMNTNVGEFENHGVPYFVDGSGSA